MVHALIQFVALFLLMLVTGVFWGPWFALHRSIQVFNEEDFIQIVKTITANLAVPMRFLMPGCILFMGLAVWYYPVRDSFGFCLNIAAFSFTVVSLVVTVLVEVPIVKQINEWTVASFPVNWRAIQERWLTFHVVRIVFSMASFVCLLGSILLMP